eukprot:tig00021038_g17534.t1
MGGGDIGGFLGLIGGAALGAVNVVGAGAHGLYLGAREAVHKIKNWKAKPATGANPVEKSVADWSAASVGGVAMPQSLEDCASDDAKDPYGNADKNYWKVQAGGEDTKLKALLEAVDKLNEPGGCYKSAGQSNALKFVTGFNYPWRNMCLASYRVFPEDVSVKRCEEALQSNGEKNVGKMKGPDGVCRDLDAVVRDVERAEEALGKYMKAYRCVALKAQAGGGQAAGEGEQAATQTLRGSGKSGKGGRQQGKKLKAAPKGKLAKGGRGAKGGKGAKGFIQAPDGSQAPEDGSGDTPPPPSDSQGPYPPYAEQLEDGILQIYAAGEGYAEIDDGSEFAEDGYGASADFDSREGAVGAEAHDDGYAADGRYHVL